MQVVDQAVMWHALATGRLARRPALTGIAISTVLVALSWPRRQRRQLLCGGPSWPDAA